MTDSSAERALIAYAVIRDQVADGDLYAGIVAFLRPIVAEFAGKRFIPKDICDRLGERYGMYVPPMVMEGLASKLSAAGLLQNRGETNQVVDYVCVGVARADLLPLPEITKVLVSYRAVVKERISELSNATDELLDEALFSRLLQSDSLGILSRRDGLESPKKSKDTLSLKPQNGARVPNPLDDHLDYVTASFLLDARERDEASFNLLADIAAANIAAETLLSYRDPPVRGDVFDEIDVYLDAPLCMDILGVNPGREAFGEQLLAEIRRAGCTVYVFLHSVLEIERILEARLGSYSSDRKPFDVYKTEPPSTRERVRLLCRHVESTIVDQLKFSVVDSKVSIPPRIRTSVGADEEKAIRDKLSGWKNEEAREADVASACDLIRMRSAQSVETRALKAGPTLVSRNTTLIRTANAAWKDWLISTRRASVDRMKSAAPLAMEARKLAGLIWITHGGAIGSVSRAMLVSNCAAAIAARRDVVTRVYNTLIETSPKDAELFAAVINDQRAERVLMDATFADPQVVTNENVFAILDDVKRATAHEVAVERDEKITQLNREIEMQRNDFVTTQEKHERERQQWSMRLEQTNNMMDLLHTNVERKRSLQLQRALSIGAFSYRAAVLIGACAGGAMGICLQRGADALFNTGHSSHTWLNWLLPMFTGALSGVLVAWDVPEFLFGSYRDRFAKAIVRRYLRLVGGDDGDVDRHKWDFRSKTLVSEYNVEAHK